jgi:hypothetical protein
MLAVFSLNLGLIDERVDIVVPALDCAAETLERRLSIADTAQRQTALKPILVGLSPDRVSRVTWPLAISDGKPLMQLSGQLLEHNVGCVPAARGNSSTASQAPAATAGGYGAPA